MALEPTGITIFCEDVRNEVGGSITIVGANPKEEIFFQNPGKGSYMIPVIGFYIKILVPIEYKYDSFSVFVFQKDSNIEKQILHATYNANNFPATPKPDDNNALYLKVTIAQRVYGLTCHPNGNIKVRASFDGKAPIPLGTLEYKFIEDTAIETQKI